MSDDAHKRAVLEGIHHFAVPSQIKEHPPYICTE